MSKSFYLHGRVWHNAEQNEIEKFKVEYGATKMNEKKDSTEPATYKAPEAARVARVGTKAIRRGVADGTIPHLRFGRNILIPRNAFHRWLDSCGQWGGHSA